MKRLLALPIVLVCAMLSVLPVQAHVATVIYKVAAIPLSPVAAPGGIVSNVWFLQPDGHVSNLGANSGIVRYALPSEPFHMTLGPDGNSWFTVGDGVATITSTGTVTSYALPSAQPGPNGIASGPDGRVWVTEAAIGMIAALDPATGAVSEYASPFAHPQGITAGPDGRLWFDAQGKPAMIAAMTTTGHVDLVSKMPGGDGNVFNIVAGSDGALWVPDSKVLHRVTTAAVVTNVQSLAGNVQMAVGHDGAFYLAARSGTGTGLYRMTTGGVFSLIRPLWGASEVAVAPDGSFWVTLVSRQAIAHVA
jgi:virginiamycin B lyase